MFKRHHFRFPTTVDKALASLDTVVNGTPGYALRVDNKGTVKLFRDQGMTLLNGFFPVFVGRFAANDRGSELQGGFRFHLFAIAVFAAFVTISVASLIGVLASPDVVAGLPEDWKWQRIRFELQFIGFAVLAAVFAWLAAKPMRERIISIISSSTAPSA